MSTFGSDQASLDSLVYMTDVHRREDHKRSEERIINRKIYAANLDAIQVDLSEIGLEGAAPPVLGVPC